MTDANNDEVDFSTGSYAGEVVPLHDVQATKTVLRAAISAASSGDNTLVGAVADKKTKVLSLVLVATSAVTVRLESGAGGTALTGVMSLAANVPFVLPLAMPGYHWCETAAATLLNLELGGAVQVSGAIVYYQEA
jgi:hypothetical protein